MKQLVLLWLAFTAYAPAALASTEFVSPNGEVERIRRHLDLALARLEFSDTIGLSQEQRERRAFVVQRLRAYRDRGVFPRNTDFPGVRVPYFIDRAGRACAVAYLMQETGFGHDVERIAQTQNNARVYEMTDPALPIWLNSSGLTIDEAAAIQPTYEHQACAQCGCDVAPVCGSDGLSYINECVADNCGEVRSIEGCCNDEPAPQTGPYCDDDLASEDLTDVCGKYVPPPTEEDCACGTTTGSPTALIPWFIAIAVTARLGRRPGTRAERMTPLSP